LPKRFELEYTGPDNKPHRPVMIHRAPFGSMERFMGILIEHYGGAFPVWLAPEQVVVLNITEHQAEYAEGVARALREAGIRAKTDLRNEKISYKIREHSLQKLPYQVVVGDKEKQAGTVAVRTRGGEDLGAMPLADFIARLRQEANA
jgi:threonyl-tRNA synthetase